MPKAAPAIPLRILKINSTSSLSGRSTLTYRITCNSDGDIHLSVVANSSSGQFNSDPIPLATIENLLTTHPADKPMSSRVLLPVFRSKSSNSPAFMFSAILAEGLVKVGTEKDSGYTIGDVAGFKQAMAVLLSSDANLDTTASTNPEATKRKRKEN